MRAMDEGVTPPVSSGTTAPPLKGERRPEWEPHGGKSNSRTGPFRRGGLASPTPRRSNIRGRRTRAHYSPKPRNRSGVLTCPRARGCSTREGPNLVEHRDRASFAHRIQLTPGRRPRRHRRSPPRPAPRSRSVSAARIRLGRPIANPCSNEDFVGSLRPKGSYSIRAPAKG